MLKDLRDWDILGAVEAEDDYYGGVRPDLVAMKASGGDILATNLEQES